MGYNTPIDALSISPCSLHIQREIACSNASFIFEIELNSTGYAMKVYHDNGNPGITEKGRDLNRFRCELNAYKNLSSLGVCEKGLVPRCYGYIDQLDPKEYRPYLDHFLHDLYNPKAIIFEYLPNAESLNCVNYSKQRFQMVIDGLKGIHKAFIHHHDIYPRNMLLVPGSPERMLWVDFDVAITFPNRDAMSRKDDEYSLYEEILVEDLGELLQEDQEQGLPPNTKFY